jgi:NADH dehydrogenase, FAD-containing subunit
VTEVTEDAVYAGDERIPAKNVIWAAGVKAVDFASTLGVEQDRQGRVVVQPDCSVPGHPEVFVVGDLACLADPRTDQPVPGVAQAAMQMGDFVGAILAREVGEAEVDGSSRGQFLYRDKGSMATIGRARAVADIGGRTFRGLFAWILWSMIHVLFLIGFRNKILVLVNWIWQWLLQARGARLITDALPAHVHVRLDARHQVRKPKKG